jgi:hypothetical protein
MKAATIVNAFLSLNKRLTFNTKGNKNALLSYVFFPPFLDMPRWYYLAKHNNRIQSKLLTDALSSIGYRTHLYNYLNENVDYSESYDLFVGHNRTFAKIANKLEPSCKKALIIAGSHPYFDTAQLKIRAENLYQRRGVKLPFPEIDGSYVEENFRSLDRQVRERIALWDGSRGALLEEIIGERDAIANSDQGKSFRAFWLFLMSQQRQEELDQLLDRALALPPIVEIKPDPRLRRIHFDWLEAGEHTQRTVARLSEQLRRFLDDKAWLENRRIVDILHGIESSALAVREKPPAGDFMSIAETSSDIELPMERPLFTPPIKPIIAAAELESGEEVLDMAALFSHVAIRKQELAGNIRRALQTQSQISLCDLLQEYPLQHGLAELAGYLQIASEWTHAVIEEGIQDSVQWQAPSGTIRRAQLPRIIFARR